MHLLILILLAVWPQFVASLDNILMPFERFQYDIEQFIPIVTQEVEFAELTGLTDDQAYEQLKSFFPTLQQRIQDLRNMGIIANIKRRTVKEAIDTMCGQGHDFGYLKVDHKVREILALLHTKQVTVQKNLALLTAVRDRLQEWSQESKAPCKRKSG